MSFWKRIKQWFVRKPSNPLPADADLHEIISGMSMEEAEALDKKIESRPMGLDDSEVKALRRLNDDMDGVSQAFKQYGMSSREASASLREFAEAYDRVVTRRQPPSPETAAWMRRPPTPAQWPRSAPVREDKCWFEQHKLGYAPRDGLCDVCGSGPCPRRYPQQKPSLQATPSPAPSPAPSDDGLSLSMQQAMFSGFSAPEPSPAPAPEFKSYGGGDFAGGGASGSWDSGSSDSSSSSSDSSSSSSTD